MSVTKERDESYYAFNIDKKKGRLLNQKTLNFDNLNKGFYDDIMNYDGIIRKEKNELGETKQKGIKESVYSYKKIPEVWTNKLTYTSELYKTIGLVAGLGTGIGFFSGTGILISTISLEIFSKLSSSSNITHID